MIPEDRKRKLLDIIEKKGFVKVGTLSEDLHVSEPTIRRDLKQLSKEGTINRSYGGASFISKTAVEWPFDYRKSLNLEEKMYVAGLAVEYIRNNDTVFLDSGSSCYCLAKKMKNLSNVHVITNSVPTLEVLGETDGIEVNGTGGRYHPRRHAFFGPAAVDYVSRHRASICFLGANSLVSGFGMMQNSEEDAAIKRLFARNAQKTVALFDSTKEGRTGLYQAVDFSEIDAVVSNAPLGRELERICENNNIEVVY